MKPILIIGACVAAAYAEEDQQKGVNLIKNGDFAENFIGASQWTITKSLSGWEIPREVEQGYGRVYNGNWGNRIVIELDSNQNDILRQKLELRKGEYNLELDYAARSGFVGTSEMSVSWNGQNVKTIKGEDDSIHTLKLPLTAVEGVNVLEIAGEGASDSFGMTLANIRITSAPPVFLYQNHLFNSDFSNPVRVTGREWVTELPGWVIQRVRHGVGHLWNKKWGNRNVIELSDNLSDTLKQAVGLAQGLYKFEMEYTLAEQNKNPASFTLWMNHKLVSARKVTNHQIHNWSFNFVVSTAGQFTFEIKGERSCTGLTIGKIQVSEVPKDKIQLFASNRK